MKPEFKIAVQEDMLPGPTLEDRFAQASDIGLDGIEFWSLRLPAQVAEIERLNGRNGVVAASINHGRRSRFLDPSPVERATAMAELEQAIELGGRIGANCVIFAPHFFGPLLPDLSPYKTAVELERELLASQLQVLAETAAKADILLCVEPINRYETHLLVRLEDAASLIAPLAHANLRIVADLFHMALDEPDILKAIRENAKFIGHVHLADSNRRLPGQGKTDFSAVLQTLKEVNYGEWLSFECGDPGDNLVRGESYLAELPASLRAMGLTVRG